MMGHRPFILVPAGALRVLQDARRPALIAWAGDWLATGTPSPTLQAGRMDAGMLATASDVQGHLLCGFDEPGCADDRRFVWVSQGDADVLASWLIPGMKPDQDAMGTAVLAQVCKAALGRLMGAMLGEPPAADPVVSTLPAHCLRPGTALAELRITLGDASIGLVHAGSLSLPPRATPARPRHCEPLDAALSDQMVTLRADLGRIDMDLASLYRLRAGDVIRLASRLDAPVALRVQGQEGQQEGMAPIQGYLGAIDQHRALEIIAQT